MRLRRRDAPWEVVDCKVVQPVPMFYDDEDIEIIRLASSETRGTYVFNMRSEKSKPKSQSKVEPDTQSKRHFKYYLRSISRTSSFSNASVHKELDVEDNEDDGDVPRARRALIFAREQLLAELAKKELNVFLLEGWRVTVMRKGRLRRIEVHYHGRGALAAGKPDMARRPPPFIELLGA